MVLICLWDSKALIAVLNVCSLPVASIVPSVLTTLPLFVTISLHFSSLNGIANVIAAYPSGVDHLSFTPGLHIRAVRVEEVANGHSIHESCL